MNMLLYAKIETMIGDILPKYIVDSIKHSWEDYFLNVKFSMDEEKRLDEFRTIIRSRLMMGEINISAPGRNR